MPLSITNENKNPLSLTYITRGSVNLTWDQATFAWDDAVGTWDSVRVPLAKESKNGLSFSYETKN